MWLHSTDCVASALISAHAEVIFWCSWGQSSCKFPCFRQLSAGRNSSRDKSRDIWYKEGTEVPQRRWWDKRAADPAWALLRALWVPHSWLPLQRKLPHVWKKTSPTPVSTTWRFLQGFVFSFLFAEGEHVQLQFWRAPGCCTLCESPHMEIRCKLGILNAAAFPSNTVWGSATLEDCLILGKTACFTKILQVRTNLALFPLSPLLRVVHFNKHSAWGIVRC